MPFKLGPGGLLRFAVVLLTVASTAGCVKDSRDDCPPLTPLPEQTRLIYFRAEDVLTGVDISRTEEFTDIGVYFFDRNRELIGERTITPQLIRDRMPIDVTGMDLEGGYVTVWSNVDNSMSLGPLSRNGMAMDRMIYNALTDPDNDGYLLPPSDLLFGSDRVAFKRIDETTSADTLCIKQKNGRIVVTVRGLDELPAADYYFDLHALYTAYNFAGNPVENIGEIMGVGSFDNDNQLVTEPVIMCHHPQGGVYDDDNCVHVTLYRKVDGTRGEDQLVATGNRSRTGEYIAFESGRTTNVLLDITEKGSVEVSIVITRWDEIYQWEYW